jgi:hypothetical protein
MPDRSSLSIQRSIQIAVRHHGSASALLAKSLSLFIGQIEWMDHDVRLNFCFRLFFRILDNGRAPSFDPVLAKKIGGKSLRYGVRLLRRYRERGLDALAYLVMEELRNRQKFDQMEQIEFLHEFIEKLFPASPFRESTVFYEVVKAPNAVAGLQPA